tara:strand:- start:1503 stop:1757 length:255 start_codon:yes stop_codon:yes gene_type:complete
LKKDKIVMVHETEGPMLGHIAGIPCWYEQFKDAIEECLVYNNVGECIEVSTALGYPMEQWKLVQVFTNSDRISLDELEELQVNF